MKRFFLTVVLILCGMMAHAQIMDTLRYSFQQKPKFFLTLTSYNSFILTDRAKINGLVLGLDWNKRVRIGVGFFGLNQNTNVIDEITISDSTGNLVTNGNLKFGYVSLSPEYTFYKNYPWQFSASMNLGWGNTYYEYLTTDSTGNKILHQTNSNRLGLTNVSVNAQYNIFKWLGLGAGLGYNFTFDSQKTVRKSFNSPVYSFGIKIFFGEIFRAIFPKKKKSGE